MLLSTHLLQPYRTHCVRTLTPRHHLFEPQLDLRLDWNHWKTRLIADNFGTSVGWLAANQPTV